MIHRVALKHPIHESPLPAIIIMCVGLVTIGKMINFHPLLSQIPINYLHWASAICAALGGFLLLKKVTTHKKIII
ncbi:MAG: hypothetical protein ABIG95_06525 [Candidatus Woesearchaeota archaeon]